MPRKTNNKGSEVEPVEISALRRYVCAPEATWGGFINIRINDKQREDFHDWEAANAAHVAGYFEDHLSEGMKISFAYDDENQAFIVTYTGRLVNMVGMRYAVSSRAGTVTQAMALAAYKHEVLAEGDYIRFSSSVKEFMQFG